MPWFKVDDGYWHDAQMMALSDGAQALWLRAGTYSAQKLLDGFVPDEALRLLRVRKRYIEELERAAVWRRSAGGWLAVRWQENIRSRSDIEADRDKTKQRVRSHRNAVTPPVTNAAPVPVPVPVPNSSLSTSENSSHLAPSSPRGAPEPDRPILPGSTAAVLREWHTATATTGVPRGLYEFVASCEAQAKAEKTTPELIARRAIEAFRADPYVQTQRAGFGLLVAQRDRWVAPPPKAAKVTQLLTREQRLDAAYEADIRQRLTRIAKIYDDRIARAEGDPERQKRLTNEKQAEVWKLEAKLA